MKKIYCLIILQFAFSIILAQSNIQKDIDWPVLSKSPWPMSFGSPQANGRTTVIGPRTSNIKWQINNPGGSGTSNGPVISSSENIYFGGEWNTQFYSMRSDTVLNWTITGGIVNYVAGGMIVDRDENIYFGTNDFYFTKLDKKGNLKWQYKTNGPIRGNLVNIGLDSVLYFTSADSYLYALTNDGKPKWEIKIGSGFYFSSPTLSPDYKTIYICGRDSNLYALNLDGTVKWKYSCKASYSVPMVDARGNIYIKQFGPTYSYEFISIRPDGTKRWGYGFNDTNFYNGFNPCMDSNGNLFIAEMDKLHSIDYNGKLRWSKAIIPATKGITCPLTCDAEGKVYFGCTSGTAYYCFSNDGDLIWSMPLNGYNIDWAPAFGNDGTMYIGVHKGPQKITMMAVKDNTSTVSNESTGRISFCLSQNYPNPFNPVTVIKYSIPNLSKVELKIFNLLGSEITQLVGKEQSAGTYEVEFDGRSLPSGVYIYTLQAGSFSDSKKLILLK